MAIIYGYTTKRLNEQVKRNISKFPADFMFQITDEEVDDLWSQNATANINSKSRSKPYVFTEQGLYMLMTVLKGTLAEKQSIALVRTFKKMKDYILENRDLMNSFVSEDDDKWLMFNAKFSSADEVFESIYRKAKQAIYVDANKLHSIEFADFCKEYPTVQIKMQRRCGIFHDRFIVIDYGITKYKPMIDSLLQNPQLVLPQ